MRTFTSALRALFVLGCLVFVPLMAVFGTSLPATVIAALTGQEIAHSSNTKATVSGAVNTSLGHAGSNDSLLHAASQPSWSGGDRLIIDGKRPVGDHSEKLASATAGIQHAAGSPPPSSASEVTPISATSVSPTSFGAKAVSATMPSNLPSRERFHGMESRLRQLGAKYYRLETSGNQGELFHFECQLPTAGNPAPPRVFEATDADAMRAVTQVVQQVEDWRAGRW